jgi:hypothetical protein
VIGRLLLSLGHLSFSSLRKTDLIILMETIAKRPGYKQDVGFVSHSVRKQYYIVLFELYHFSQEGIIDNGLYIDPKSLLDELSLNDSVEPTRRNGTPRIPEYIARPLLNTTIQLFEGILSLLPSIHKSRYDDVISAITIAVGGHLEHVRGRKPSVLEFTMTICFIIVAAFTGFRISEQLSVSSKGLSNSRSGLSLQSRVRKTSKRAAGFLTMRPVPPIVQKAILLAEKIGVAEKDYPSSIFALLKDDGSLQLDDAAKWADRINRFAKIAGVPHLVDRGMPVQWHFTTQQFRRFFALFYVRRYSGPLDPLRFHFRHITDDMILFYTNDPDTARFLIEEKYEFTSQLMQMIATGELKATGSFGNMLSNLGASYRAQSLTPQQIQSMIVEWIDEERLELVATPYGLCASSQARAAFAVCGSAADGMPNITRRTMDGCFVCPNGCQTEQDIPALRIEFLVNKEVTESIKEGPIHQVAIDRMRKIKDKLLALETA